MPILVKFNADYCDDFTCEEYRIFSDELATLQDVWEEIDQLIERGEYFGTNEEFEEGELQREDFVVTIITEEDARVLQRHLGECFGLGILSCLYDRDAWDEDEDDDEDE